MNKYQDIINLSYPYPSSRKKMSMAQRGAQFAPFAALTGYDDAIKEEARYTSEKITLSEEEINKINQRLHYLQQHNLQDFHVCLIYFVKDLHKKGGSYHTYYGTIKKIIPSECKLITQDNTHIAFEDLFDLQSSDIPEYL